MADFSAMAQVPEKSPIMELLQKSHWPRNTLEKCQGTTEPTPPMYKVKHDLL